MGKKSTNFAGSPHTMGFATFSRTMRNVWENPCVSHMIIKKKKKSSNCTKSLLTVNESNIISKSNEDFAVSLHPSFYNITSLNKTPV